MSKVFKAKIIDRDGFTTDSNIDDSDASSSKQTHPRNSPPTTANKRHRKGGKSQFHDAINKLTEVMEKGLEQQAKGQDSKLQQAVDVLTKEYKDQDDEWLLKAIEIVKKEENTAILLRLTSAFRDRWLAAEMKH
jgi:hypothetical protein